MNKWVIGIFGFIGFALIAVVISVFVIISHRNEAVALKENVSAQYTANKSEYDNMWKSFVEMAQVSDKQAEDFKKIYTDMITGRYSGDKNLLFKMVKEDNPKIDQGLYRDLQNHVAAGRSQFNNSQKTLADKIREYNTYIRVHFIMNTFCNYKTLNADDFIVTSGKTKKAFDSGEDDAIDLNGK